MKPLKHPPRLHHYYTPNNTPKTPPVITVDDCIKEEQEAAAAVASEKFEGTGKGKKVKPPPKGMAEGSVFCL